MSGENMWTFSRQHTVYCIVPLVPCNARLGMEVAEVPKFNTQIKLKKPQRTVLSPHACYHFLSEMNHLLCDCALNHFINLRNKWLSSSDCGHPPF